MILTLRGKPYCPFELVLEPRIEERELLLVMQPQGERMSLTATGGIMSISLEELRKALAFCEKLLEQEA